MNELDDGHLKWMMEAEPLTVGELIKKLEKMPKKAKVYMVFDKESDGAWDEDREGWRYAVPLVYVNKEVNYVEDMSFVGKETNVLLEVENP